MPAVKRNGRSQHTSLALDPEPDPVSDDTSDFEEEWALEDEGRDVVRVRCPDCERPIAVFDDEDVLPRHALCPTPWNPFGLTVCQGSGRSVDDAAFESPVEGQESALAALLTLPEGLDWRTQPFSHVGGPDSRPMMAARLRPATVLPQRCAA